MNDSDQIGDFALTPPYAPYDKSKHVDLTIYFDGACEPINPGGIATVGWCVLNELGSELAHGHSVVKRGDGATNNYAEWCALGFALRWLLEGHKDIHTNKSLLIHGDSQLVCNQLTQTWDCHKESLRKLRDRCWKILGQLGLKEWYAEWIPRERNERADELSKLAYTELTGKQPPERPKKKRG